MIKCIKVLLIVILVSLPILLLIPGLVREKISSNESNALRTLKVIATIQSIFKEKCYIDQDKDGIGEFGSLTEITGTSFLRGKSIKATPVIITKLQG